MSDGNVVQIPIEKCEHSEQHRFACLLCGKIICRYCKALHLQPHGVAPNPRPGNPKEGFLR